MTQQEQAAANLADEVASLIEPVYQRLETVASRVAELSTGTAAGQLTEALLQPVADLLVSMVVEDPVIAGMGFVAEVGAVAGHDRFMSWWQKASGDKVARLRLNFDPSSVDVYDYLQMEWFQQARTRHRAVYGPYVDYSGSEMYIFTMSVPVLVEGRFVGVAGADVAVGELERQLVSVLARSPHEAVLVNSERRVLAANTPRWVVGTRLPQLPAVGSEFASVAEVPLGVGWVVATVTGPTGQQNGARG